MARWETPSGLHILFYALEVEFRNTRISLIINIIEPYLLDTRTQLQGISTRSTTPNQRIRCPINGTPCLAVHPRRPPRQTASTNPTCQPLHRSPNQVDVPRMILIQDLVEEGADSVLLLLLLVGRCGTGAGGLGRLLGRSGRCGCCRLL